MPDATIALCARIVKTVNASANELTKDGLVLSHETDETGDGSRDGRARS